MADRIWVSLGRGLGLQQVQSGEFHAGGAEPALDGPFFDECLLDGVQRLSPEGASPSTVRICLPFISTARVRQELTLLPSTITVQAPQSPEPQPSLVPVRFRSSRRYFV